jgi:ParB-like chromosome segregation protein Spo0J
MALLPWETVHPVGAVQWIEVDRIQANDYNPNSVPFHEMNLLHTSVAEDGYTQPIVAMWDPDAKGGVLTEPGRYVIVDGFHRYTVMRRFADIFQTTDGYLPVVVIDKPIADRIASTVRHNRARGKHSVAGMSNLVFAMLMAGESDEAVCKKIGLEAEELARLKHITGYSKLYADQTYTSLTLTKTQQDEKRAYALAHPDETVPEDI